jgi:O-antigen/teichoic acid export membrane protein
VALAPPATGGPEQRALARGGIPSFIGAAASAVLGFLLTVALARLLGESGTGIVLQGIAVFTIALSLGRAGMDSTAIWLLPRLAESAPEQLRGTLTFLALVALIAGCAAAGAVMLLASNLGGAGASSNELAEVLVAIAWFLPVAAVLLVVLSATRALGGVLPYVAVGNLALPAARLALVAAIAAIGGSLAAVGLAWTAPLPAALAAGAVVLALQLRRHARGLDVRIPRWVTSRTRARIQRYAAPRMLSAGLEQAVLWLDVLIVGAILGPAAAGIYGGASRFIAAGLIVDTALRVVVSPRFSVLLGAGRIRDAQGLYQTAARWLVLFSTPIYLVLAIHAPVVLGWLGPGFREGATALAILSIGAVITFMAGNIHSVLLMSGRSGWAAFNKVVVLIINVVGNLLLIPVLGINGAAITWAGSMLIDAALATVQVHRLIGVRVDLVGVCYATLVPVLSVGVPALVIRLLWGSNGGTLLLSLAVGAVLFVSWCLLDGRRLQLRNLALVVRTRRKE